MGWFLVLLAYASGMIPFGLLVGRLHGIDVRRLGSGNIGATNVGRALGMRWAALVLALDALKGLLPVLLTRAIFFGDTQHRWVGACMVAAVLGHVFPAVLRFRGGKGVATALGVTLAAAPIAALIGAATYGLVVAVRRVSAQGSLAGVLAALAALWLGGAPRAIVAAFVAICVLIVARHGANLRAFWQGR